MNYTKHYTNLFIDLKNSWLPYDDTEWVEFRTSYNPEVSNV